MKKKTEKILLFDRSKYIWLVVGLLVTALGFLLMIGGGSADPNEFSEGIFSFRRMTLAPILVLAGFGIQIYAILKKTTNTADSPELTKTAATPKPQMIQQKEREHRAPGQAKTATLQKPVAKGKQKR